MLLCFLPFSERESCQQEKLGISGQIKLGSLSSNGCQRDLNPPLILSLVLLTKKVRQLFCHSFSSGFIFKVQRKKMEYNNNKVCVCVCVSINEAV